jgi:hypothetical protein
MILLPPWLAAAICGRLSKSGAKIRALQKVLKYQYFLPIGAAVGRAGVSQISAQTAKIITNAPAAYFLG